MKAIDVAKTMLGWQEVRDCSKLMAFFKEHDIDGDIIINPAKTSWCSAFMNGCQRAANLNEKGTGSLMARSWLKWGKKTNEEDAQEGDVVIFDFEGDGIHGHVAFFVSWDDDNNTIKVLGGNQANQVKYSDYIQDKVIGIRRQV